MYYLNLILLLFILYEHIFNYIEVKYNFVWKFLEAEL